MAYENLEKKAAAGIDGVTWYDFGNDLVSNLKELHEEVHSGKYRPKPARRHSIAKEDGSERVLSIICLRDKVVQQAMVQVLSQIYEVDFMGFSYGYRTGRGQHDALDALCVVFNQKRVNWVLDMDISQFFDTIEHDWLIRFLEHRISDRRVLKLITRWLKVGHLDEQGHRVAAHIGSPQGSVISPLLANVYLHYVLDLWLHRERKRAAPNEAYFVRYADDAILCFEKEEDARMIKEKLADRLQSFGLSLHPKKTRLIRFGRFAKEQMKAKGEKGKPATFDFLGFTFYCATKG